MTIHTLSFSRPFYLLFFLFFVVPQYTASGQNSYSFKKLNQFKAVEAHQGVAVDGEYFYAIDNRRIGKYDKMTGKKLDEWVETKDGSMIHLNSGIVRGDTLFCAHSNFPQLPMTSSIEMWDTDTMEHIGSHSFGIYKGSGTWLDWHNNSWWMVFAHYDRDGGLPDKGSEWTTLVRFTPDWQPIENWVFPDQIIRRFHPNSNSGGGWGPEERIYVTGHDAPEVYIMELPESGSILRYVGRAPFPGKGQGIAWDPAHPNILYGIIRDSHTVVSAEIQGN